MPNNTRTLVMTLFALVMLAGIVVAVWPVHITVFGTDGNCGPAVVSWVRYANSSNPIERQCFSEGGQRALIGGAVAIIGFIGLIVAGATMPRYLPWWDGRGWRLDSIRQARGPAPPATVTTSTAAGAPASGLVVGRRAMAAATVLGVRSWRHAAHRPL